MRSFKGRILCVDDDADTCEMLGMVLKQAGYEVHSTLSPLDSIRLLKQQTYDLIMIDKWMPEMEGDELTREIRKTNQSTPILYYSAAGFESDKKSARHAGAQGYLVKPLGITELVDEVARLIAEARIAFPVAVESAS